MFEDWSENITETDLLHEEKDKGLSPKKESQKTNERNESDSTG